MTRAGKNYIPKGCDQQGRLHDGQWHSWPDPPPKTGKLTAEELQHAIDANTEHLRRLEEWRPPVSPVVVVAILLVGLAAAAGVISLARVAINIIGGH